MYLVVDHVLEPLVVGGANEDLRVQLTPCEPVVQNLGEGQGREGKEGRREEEMEEKVCGCYNLKLSCGPENVCCSHYSSLSWK